MKANDKKIKNSKFESNLQIELKNRKDIEAYGYDFIPRTYHWTDIDEQKINVNKIEEITNKNK